MGVRVAAGRPTVSRKMLTPEEAVQRQLEAFNDHDLDAFLRLFAADVVIHDLVDGSVVLRGIDAFRARYERVFQERPMVKAELAGRLSLGSFVIDRERLTDGDDHPPEDALAIYNVEAGVVTRMWFIEPEHRRVGEGSARGRR
jgi:hypothetical protein